VSLSLYFTSPNGGGRHLVIATPDEDRSIFASDGGGESES
jgi:hypothetical protein